MRLLITTDTVGGVWTFTRELTVGLLELGCAVMLVSFGRLPSADQTTWVERVSRQWGEAFQFLPTEFPLEWMQANGGFYEASADLLRRTFASFRADLLHSNQLCYGLLSREMPVVVTVHSDVRSWFRGCRGTQPEISPWMARYDELVEGGVRAAAKIVAPTAWMLETAEAQYGPFRASAVIPNGRSVKRPAAGVARLRQAVTVGRLWDEAKDVSLLASVKAPMPLLVAGETGSPEAEMAALTPNVGYLGNIDEGEVLELFRRSAIYIVTSRYEPFGLAPLEAALCGCAIVARDLASLREVWGDAAVYFHDAEELTAVLQWLQADADMLHRMALLAQQRASGYSREAMSERYLAHFRELADVHGADRTVALDVA